IWRIMESVPGSEAAAPTPMTIRPMTSSVDEVATAHTIEPKQKIATPRSIIFFRPKLSPSEPQISIRLPKARAYPPTTHCRSETLECNSDCTLERTALITVISRKVRKRIDSNAANPKCGQWKRDVAGVEGSDGLITLAAPLTLSMCPSSSLAALAPATTNANPDVHFLARRYQRMIGSNPTTISLVPQRQSEPPQCRHQ